MKLYADSADIETVTPLLEDHIITGVTTNPTILRKSGLDASSTETLYRHFLDAGAQEIFFQATGATRKEMTSNADTIRQLGPRAVVKIPATALGFRVAAELTHDNTPVLMTAVYTVAQAVASAAIGARYIAPYFGRLGDSGADALDIVGSMHDALAPTPTDVLVASVRTPQVAADLAVRGIHHITAHPTVIEAMLADPTSDTAATEFERAAAGVE